MPLTQLPAVLAEVADLAALFDRADRRLYLVGGIVRDLWLDRDVGLGSEVGAGSGGARADIDLTTDAMPAESKQIMADWADALWLQGERFGTIGARRGNRSFEVTTHRAEVYTPASRKPEVAFGTDITVDLSRRDFTVNAMAIDAAGGELVDPFDGVTDLVNGQLRTPLDPKISFSDDPLRMLRAARFATSYGLVPTPALVIAAQELHGRLDIVSAERVRDELEKFLSAESLTPGLEFLETTDLLAQVIPGATGEVGHRSIELAARVEGPWWLRLAALLYPSARLYPSTSHVGELLRSIRCSRDTTKLVTRVIGGVQLLEQHNANPSGFDAPAIRAWADAVRPHAPATISLAEAVGVSNELERAWRSLAESEDLDDLDPPLTGPDVMNAFGLEPGPQVGLVLKAVRAARIAQGPLGADEALAIAGAWLDTAKES